METIRRFNDWEIGTPYSEVCQDVESMIKEITDEAEATKKKIISISHSITTRDVSMANGTRSPKFYASVFAVVE